MIVILKVSYKIVSFAVGQFDLNKFNADILFIFYFIIVAFRASEKIVKTL